MVVSCFRGDIELARGFLGGPSRGDQTQNLDLARCETGEALRHVPAGGLTGAGENRLDRLGAEFPVPDRAAQLCRRSRIAQCRPVRSRLARGLEGLGRGKHTRRGREVVRAGVAMIATSVEAFMMAQNQCGDRLAFSAERRQRALSMIGMKVRRIGFALGQRPGAHPR